jgi:ParB family chromosome partitioning protein
MSKNPPTQRGFGAASHSRAERGEAQPCEEYKRGGGNEIVRYYLYFHLSILKFVLEFFSIEQHSTEVANDLQILNIPVENIRPDANQPRKHLGDLADLAESIRENGIIQPIIVTEAERGRYHIVAGERRYTAAKQIGLKTIPAIVRTFEDIKAQKAIQLIENIQRKELDPLEEANAFRELIETHGMTQKQLAKKLGISPAAVNQTLRMRSLPETILNDIPSSQGVSKSLLLEIAKLDDKKKQLQLWQHLKQNQKLTVREARQRGTYKKHYAEFAIEKEGIRVLVRWEQNSRFPTQERALQFATKELKNLIQISKK